METPWIYTTGFKGPRRRTKRTAQLLIFSFVLILFVSIIALRYYVGPGAEYARRLKDYAQYYNDKFDCKFIIMVDDTNNKAYLFKDGRFIVKSRVKIGKNVGHTGVYEIDGFCDKYYNEWHELLGTNCYWCYDFCIGEGHGDRIISAEHIFMQHVPDWEQGGYLIYYFIDGSGRFWV